MTPEQMAEVVMTAVKAATAPLVERIHTLESKSLIPGPPGEPGAKGERGDKGDPGDKGERGDDGLQGPMGLQGERGEKGMDGLNGKDGADGLNGKDGADGLHGKDGINGVDGKDGFHGKDGADGIGWDDLAVEQIDERTFSIKCQRGLQIKEVGRLSFPVEIYRGVFVQGKQYERGDCATFGGSEWHCNAPTTDRPGEGSKAWTLKVKRGRDGKDGRDALTTPVVSVRR